MSICSIFGASKKEMLKINIYKLEPIYNMQREYFNLNIYMLEPIAKGIIYLFFWYKRWSKA